MERRWLIKLLSLCGLDINSQAQMLCEYLRSKGYDATNVVMSPNGYLNYKCDVPLWERKDFEIKWDDYDFFVLRWLPDAAGNPSTRMIADLIRQGVIRRNNCIIRVHGSDARYYPHEYLGLNLQHNLTTIVNGYDYSLASRIGFAIQFIPFMVDTDKLWTIAQKTERNGAKDGNTWISHSPTDPSKKGTNAFVKAVKELKAEGVKIEADIITQTPYDEAIVRKAACDLCFDQASIEMGIGTFGMSLIEALAMGKYCIGQYNHFTYAMYPHLADIVWSMNDFEQFKTNIRTMIEHDWFAKPNSEGKKFVWNEFRIDYVGKKWEHILAHVQELKA